MEPEDEHTHYRPPYMGHYRQEGAELQIYYFVYEHGTAEKKLLWFADPRSYVPLRFCKTIQGFYEVRMFTACV